MSNLLFAKYLLTVTLTASIGHGDHVTKHDDYVFSGYHSLKHCEAQKAKLKLDKQYKHAKISECKKVK